MDLTAFAAAGPAFPHLARFGPIDWPRWHAVAGRLAADLGGAVDLDRRIHHLYLPVLSFCDVQVRRAAHRPLLVGVQAPQGAGKTTLVRHLIAHLPDFGLRGAGVSIDDFYLTRDAQLRVAAAHPDNPYLEYRGYPGTHDIELGERTLSALGGLGPGARDEVVRVPVYDKSRHGGRGDRAPESAWRDVSGPLDVVFLEGWMLGFQPVAETRIADPRLVPPNRALESYARWHRQLGAFVQLRATDPHFVINWRMQAEAEAAAAGRPALSREAAEDYVRRFLPAYALYAGMPGPLPRDESLVVYLDEQRRPVAR